MSSSILPYLENTFGGLPSLVYDHGKYLTYDECREEFTCKLCTKVIHKNATKNLEAHLRSESHRKQSCSADEVTQALTISFGGKIPQIVQNNSHILDIVEEGYECVLCEKILKTSSSDPKISVNNFSYHLTSSRHEESLDCFDEKICQLRDIYGEIPLVVENNTEFLQLDRTGKNYVCTLCNIQLRVYKNNMERTKSVFEDHFYSDEHLWSAKWSKVVTLIPELKHGKLTVHTYLTRNIDYISNNGTDFFCSLCHENIKRNYSDVNETEENLKHHFLSLTHKENMFSRQNEDNVKLNHLSKIIGTFNDEILKNLRYLELSDGTFSCSICDEEIYTESGDDEWNDDIIIHLESGLHQSNASEEEERHIDLKENLENVFGKIPSAIEDNLSYIEYVHGNSFWCTLCCTTLKSRNLERHINSNRHIEAAEDEESVSESLHEDFEDLLGQDYKDELPQCIYDNWNHIEFEKDNGNFLCTLCDETILIDEGNRKEEITMQNFKTHLFSAVHITRLKQKATKETKTFEKLESIFGGIPKCILSNMYVLHEKDEDSFSCDLCNVEIRLGSSTRTTKQNFLQHLRGSGHKTNIEDIETSIDNAYKFLDEKFSIPEDLLRNIDFWDNSNEEPNLYCTLCQDNLVVDLDNLKQTRRNLECHIDSERHMSNLEDL